MPNTQKLKNMTETEFAWLWSCDLNWQPIVIGSQSLREQEECSRRERKQKRLRRQQERRNFCIFMQSMLFLCCTFLVLGAIYCLL